jgi:hypothetical protein
MPDSIGHHRRYKAGREVKVSTAYLGGLAHVKPVFLPSVSVVCKICRIKIRQKICMFFTIAYLAL